MPGKVSAEEFARDMAAIAKREYIVQLERKQKILLSACKSAYRKHHLNDDAIGWDELGEILLNAICETIGDKGYQRWKNEIR